MKTQMKKNKCINEHSERISHYCICILVCLFVCIFNAIPFKMELTCLSQRGWTKLVLNVVAIWETGQLSVDDLTPVSPMENDSLFYCSPPFKSRHIA